MNEPRSASARGAAGPRGPALRDRRSLQAQVRRLAEHREGSVLLSKSQGEVQLGTEVRAAPGRIRNRDVLFFFAQLSVMVSANVPLVVALDGIARQCDRLRLREVLKELQTKVEGGQQLSFALGGHPKVFPTYTVHLVRAGEACGDLEGMLRRVCEMLERDYEMKKKLKSALTYPVVMMVLAVATIAALFTFILPKFRAIYAGKEDKLPAPTKALLAIGDFTTHYAIHIGIAAIAVIAAIVVFVRSPRGKIFVDGMMLALPVMGGVVRRFSLARSVRTLGVLLQSGVPVLSALELARDLSANAKLSGAWEYVRGRVANGGRIHEGMASQEWFPGTLVQMTAMGESGGILDSVLARVGEFYDGEAEAAVHDATALLEPAMVVIVGCVVGFIAMSIMLPIFNMSKIVH